MPQQISGTRAVWEWQHMHWPWPWPCLFFPELASSSHLVGGVLIRLLPLMSLEK